MLHWLNINTKMITILWSYANYTNMFRYSASHNLCLKINQAHSLNVFFVSKYWKGVYFTMNSKNIKRRKPKGKLAVTTYEKNVLLLLKHNTQQCEVMTCMTIWNCPLSIVRGGEVYWGWGREVFLIHANSREHWFIYETKNAE